MNSMSNKRDVLQIRSSTSAARSNFGRVLGALSFALVLAGCATSGNPKDPIEGFNRAMFAINDGVDQAVLRPVAVGYDAVLPSPVKKGVTNFFSNVADLFIGVNNILQGKVANGVSDIGRVLVNSTVGLLGLIDVASDIGMEKHEEDFGQTFGRWGVGSGAYVVLPLMGPSTVRDTVGQVLDSKANPIPQLDDVSARNSLLALNLIDKRASFLAADKVVEAAALDKYSYVRDAHLQRRLNLIYDGNPPRERDDAWLLPDTVGESVVVRQTEPAVEPSVSVLKDVPQLAIK